MKVFIYGYAGNMAARYCAILDALKHEHGGLDVRTGPGAVNFAEDEADAFIIATPTATHLDVIKRAAKFGKHILCEKPISKDMAALKAAMAECRTNKVSLQMVSQYDELAEPRSVGPTHYDYFKSGPDGLYWDCINIIWNASGAVTLSNKSPYWTCAINGKALSLAHMDWAYVEMIRRWLLAPRDDITRIIASHEKCARLEAEWAAKS